MDRSPDFIGLGAQKAGTSWIYACLYEHAELCLPVKEIHFFSRQRNWEKGYTWYEQVFGQCPPNVKAGEFSTSYLTSPVVPERIYQRYPSIKLIASLRHPIDRAYSNYLNDIKSGIVLRSMPFEQALKSHPEYIEQGHYATHLQNYLRFFPRNQVLILVYEDCINHPLEFIQSIYKFLEVESVFIPSMLHKRINTSEVPQFLWLEKYLIHISGFLQNTGFRNLWWFIKKIGIANYFRKLNAYRSSKQPEEFAPQWRKLIYEQLEGEITEVEEIVGRTLQEWRR